MSANQQTRYKKRKPRSDFRRLARRFMSSLLRSLFLLSKPTRRSEAGFVLPTAALLLLVLTLTVGAISYRSFSRSASVIAQNEQQVIDSAAAPTIDRAKSKLEYLFSQDSRFPGGVPASDVIASLMLNDGQNGIPQITVKDPYTFPDEVRIDIGGTTDLDNAWLFKSDIDGDGSIGDDEVIVYSVLMDDENAGVNIVSTDTDAKASALVTRNGPINTAEALAGCGQTRAPEQGWQGLDSATLQKNFQVTAFVANRSDVNRTASTLEFQQVRQANRGNKWGAWFRYDIEVFPGATDDFFWNGAMHTEGNILAAEKFKARMISSHNSCLYREDASEMSMAEGETFQGQLMAAKIDNNTFASSNNGAAEFHLFNGQNTPPIVNAGTNDSVYHVTKLKADKDSVIHNSGNDVGPDRMLLDPIKILADNTSAHREAPRSGFWGRKSGWDDDNNEFPLRKRIFNDNTLIPYVDDTYRADDRYGPKAVYDESNRIPAGKTVGDTIPSTATDLVDFVPSNGVYGLDGYWERRAIGQGLRVIVGQRLELGNASGWKGAEIFPDVADADQRDPLYPPNYPSGVLPNSDYDPEDGSYMPTGGGNGDQSDIFTEEIQRRTLYDNLAAVQSMAVYHYTHASGELPLACVAATAHPGTDETIIQSRTFNTVDINGTAALNTDFFNGVGTDGWEFAFPYTTESAFATAIGVGEPLGKVLRNLGRFAGDPLGGAPSFKPEQTDGNVHPYPYLASWGDFSNLRRILASGTTYASLSPADKSTLHTAACTVGMLSYNLGNEIQLSTFDLSTVNALGVHFAKLVDGANATNGANKDIDALIGETGDDGALIIQSGAKGRPGFGNGDWVDTVDNSSGGDNPRTGCGTDNLSTYDRACDAADYYGQFTTQDFYRAILNKNGLGASAADKYAAAVAFIKRGSQFQRDRLLGFRPGGVPNVPSTGANIVWVPESGLVPPTVGGAQLSTGCDPDIFRDGTPQEDRMIALSLALCQDVEKNVKYPSLYYLFPYFQHDHDGKNDANTSGIYVDHEQPVEEEYIADTYIANLNKNSSDNGYLALSNTEILSIATEFKTRDYNFPSSTNAWVLPTSSATQLTDPDDRTQSFRITVGSSGRDVTFLDKGMFEGRENMGVRMLDFDLQKLTTNTTGGDHWISDTDGIVYAFREDAVREDGIVRPKDAGTAWTDCDSWSKVHNFNGDAPANDMRDCRMRVISTAPFLQDPPLIADTLISTKPIDFYPDPERRPNGFRLVNGEILNRADDVLSGMTFVSDNSVYIKGDFNLHTSGNSTACNELLEEFDKRVYGGCDGDIDFYTGRTGDNGTPPQARGFNSDRFANPAVDKWRPVEIVGDAVGILSGRYRDGNIQDGFTVDRSFNVRSGEPAVPAGANGRRGHGISSYMNQNRPSGPLTNPNRYETIPAASDWQHVVSGDVTTPVVVDRNGQVLRADGTPYPRNQFLHFVDSDNQWKDSRGADVQRAEPTNVNAIFISGIIPSQAGASYGGLHNFPRLLEYWESIDLSIFGGFFQLNFSTSATAPFDADAWEPGTTPSTSKSRIEYYGAADRNWGYDIGLQYAPAGPISRRFVTIGRPRSEFYRELPVEDPYVMNLRCAAYTDPDTGASVAKVDPAADCT